MNPFYYDEDMPYKHKVLLFPKEWIGTRLPHDWEHPVFGKTKRREDQTRYFQIELLDTEDNGKIYLANAWPGYEEWDHELFPGYRSVHIHLFLEHYCACHRKSDVGAAGGPDDGECEGDRFHVRSITVPTHAPGVVLYTETMTIQELEASYDHAKAILPWLPGREQSSGLV